MPVNFSPSIYPLTVTKKYDLIFYSINSWHPILPFCEWWQKECTRWWVEKSEMCSFPKRWFNHLVSFSMLRMYLGNKKLCQGNKWRVSHGHHSQFSWTFTFPFSIITIQNSLEKFPFVHKKNPKSLKNPNIFHNSSTAWPIFIKIGPESKISTSFKYI